MSPSWSGMVIARPLRGSDRGNSRELVLRSAGRFGSAVDKDGKFVGLLFAGSERSAVISKAEHIIDGLGIAVEPLEGQYGLTVSTSPGGSVAEPGEGMSVRNAGEVVDLVAVPDEHWHFLEWTGDVNTVAEVSSARTTITMNDSYSITAVFEVDEGWCSLTTSSAAGGSVTAPVRELSSIPPAQMPQLLLNHLLAATITS